MSSDSPDQSPTEQLRLMNNIVRTGRVEAVNPSIARCRVRTGELLTDWLPWLTLAAGGAGQARHWRTPAVNEECVLLAPGGDLAQALVLPGLFCQDMPQNAAAGDVERHDFSGTDFWEHNRGEGTLVFEIASCIQLKVGASLLTITPDGTTLQTPHYAVDSPQSEFSGNVAIAGGISVAGGGSGGTSSIRGNFQIEGDELTHNGNNISGTHKHAGVHGETGGRTDEPLYRPPHLRHGAPQTVHCRHHHHAPGVAPGAPHLRQPVAEPDRRTRQRRYPPALLCRHCIGSHEVGTAPARDTHQPESGEQPGQATVTLEGEYLPTGRIVGLSAALQLRGAA
jgi:phage baseplate assembly protein V